MAWKPLPKNRPGTLSPNRDNEPLSDKGASVICSRCGRIRGFGERCQCERWTPDGQLVEEETAA